MRINEIRGKLKTSFIGKTLIYHQEVSSTNEVAKKLAKEGFVQGTVVLAETQTRGRGRLGREWFSPKGGLWFSIILRPEIEPKNLHCLTFAAATATSKTLRNLYGLKAEIKWPNDVLIGGRKICGILTEARTKLKKVDFAVVGVGINANIDMEEFPYSLQEKATSLKAELGRTVNLEALFCNLLLQIENSYLRMLNQGFHTILGELRNLAMFLGKQVEIVSFGESFIGVAEEVDEAGALILRLQNGRKKRIVAGDLQILKLKR